MKIAGTIARYLLGIMFLIFGVNELFPFIPMGPLPAGTAGQFLGALFASHYVYLLGVVMVVSALLLLFNRYVGLGLTLLGPVLVNILAYHLLMDPKGIGPGTFATLLWFLVFWQHRAAFKGIFAAHLPD